MKLILKQIKNHPTFQFLLLCLVIATYTLIVIDVSIKAYFGILSFSEKFFIGLFAAGGLGIGFCEMLKDFCRWTKES